MRVLLSLLGGNQREEDEDYVAFLPLHENCQEPLDEGHKRKATDSQEETEVASLPETEIDTKRPRYCTELQTHPEAIASCASGDEEDCKPPAKPTDRKPAPDSKPPAQLKMGCIEEYRELKDEDEDEDPAHCSNITIKSVHSILPQSTEENQGSGSDATATTSTLAQQLKSRGLEICPQKGDGNCFFRAVSLQVYGDATMHPEVRQSCCDFMAKDEAHFSQFIDDEVFADYVERKRKDGVHGNNPEIQAISELFSRPVEVYTEESGGAFPINIFQSDYKDQFPIRLSYHDGNHYNAIIDPLVPTAGLGLGMPGLKPGLADQLQLSNAVIRSDEDEDVERALKESRQSAASQQCDDLQRALKESVLSDNRLDTVIFKSDVDITNFELEQAVLESSIGGNGKIPARPFLPMLSSSIPTVASIPSSSEVPLVASLPSGDMDEWTITRRGDDYPQIVQELVMNGFDVKEVVRAYELIGENFDDLLAFLVSNRSS